MSFIIVTNFDENNEIKVFKKMNMDLESYEKEDNGSFRGKVRVKHDYSSLKSDAAVPMTLAEAERHVLEPFSVFWPYSNPPLNNIPPENHLAHRMAMAAANIGASTGRGIANTVVCHPSQREKVDACWDKTKMVDQYDPLTDDTVAVEKPYFPQGPFEIFEHPNAPEDSVLVMYRGEDETDQPLYYVDGHGLLLNSEVIDVGRYGKFVKAV